VPSTPFELSAPIATASTSLTNHAADTFDRLVDQVDVVDAFLADV